MQYSMIIVDDEKIIREGLKRFIEKKECGFSVVRLFDDGKDAIEYLQDNKVDLVFTDIRMLEVSGLELAQYLRRTAPNTEIVILSGYKEFEYAKQAIENDVSYYLIKPIANQEILRVLEEIRQKLDERHKNETKLLQYDKLLEEIQSQFFVDLIFGGNKFYDGMEQKWERLHLDFDTEKVLCTIIHIKWSEDFINEKFPYGQDGADRTIKNLFSLFGNKCCCTLLGDERYLILSDTDTQKNLEYLKQWTRDNLGIEIYADLEYSCIGISPLSEYCDFIRRKAAGQADNAVKTKRYTLLNTYINLKMYNEATELFCNLLSAEYSGISPQKLKEQAVEIVLFVVDNAVKNGVQINSSKYIQMINDGIKSLSDVFKEFLSDIEETSRVDDVLISKIKDYVQTNYDKDITLETVGKNVNLNPVYMSRFFKQRTGESFSDYLLSLRMTNAIRLLKSNKYKVYQIAEMVGYKSYKYFSKQFKNYTGYPPKTYCRAVWNINTDEAASDDGDFL